MQLMTELKHFDRELSDDDPYLLAAVLRLQMLRTTEADIPDLDEYRLRRQQARPLPPDAS
ncbi:hypothetical protein M2152_000936 [Microbacteriaceae bacterium SG_E_30_P1]|uniref:Uncharacterized protein n=2 Tax=Antiquaquibacter oligotrophicus TaxID=2880260 RepID=A0ABT6KLM6_9MICO|nr:hypothetical protein [Antiquaquibacter oligotrophicus]